jgi:hypothetical protein
MVVRCREQPTGEFVKRKGHSASAASCPRRTESRGKASHHSFQSILGGDLPVQPGASVMGTCFARALSACPLFALALALSRPPTPFILPNLLPTIAPLHSGQCPGPFALHALGCLQPGRLGGSAVISFSSLRIEILDLNCSASGFFYFRERIACLMPFTVNPTMNC